MVAKQTSSYRSAKPPGQQPTREPKLEEPVPTNGGNGHALVKSEALPAWLSTYESTGEGLSTDAKDNIVPRATLLQSTSKQCKNGDPKFIRGAEPGQVYVEGIEELIECKMGKVGADTYNGPGLLMQACFWDKAIVEFIENGGGFVTTHELESEDIDAEMRRLGATPQYDSQNSRRPPRWAKANHEFHEVRRYAFYLHREKQDEHGSLVRTGEIIPVALSFKSTEHTFARKWMFTMNRVRLPHGAPADIWLSLWRLTTRWQSNSAGQSWYGWHVDRVGWVNDPTEGRALNEAFKRGEKTIADEEPSSETQENYTDSRVNPDDMDVQM